VASARIFSEPKIWSSGSSVRKHCRRVATRYDKLAAVTRPADCFPALKKRIREALATRGRPGIRVIAERFGVNPSTVQRISRPFDGVDVAVA
jgi:hypothetical protein